MEYRIIKEEEQPSCLECGTQIVGRRDKKFCSLSCKNEYNNRKVRTLREYRASIQKSISRNYEILEMLLRENIFSVKLDEIEPLGFNPSCVTGHHGGKHDEYSCYDILYYMSGSKIFNIHRLELTRP